MRATTLRAFNDTQISRAGPRYAPSIDVGAPNLQIVELIRTFDALAFTPDFRSRIGGLSQQFQEAWLNARSSTIRSHFQQTEPERLVLLLSSVQVASPTQVLNPLRECKSLARRIARKLDRCDKSLWNQTTAAQTDNERHRLQRIEYELRRLQRALRSVREVLDSQACELLTKNVMLLLGSWGMGKTHSLCDLARNRMDANLPVLIALAHELPVGMDPLAALCKASRLASTTSRLLAGLEKMGQRKNARALLIIDAINEGDRRQWRRYLRRLCLQLRQYPHVGVVLSCRTPFDQLIISHGTRPLMVAVEHPGFGDIEFDAQLAFFNYWIFPRLMDTVLVRDNLIRRCFDGKEAGDVLSGIQA